MKTTIAVIGTTSEFHLHNFNHTLHDGHFLFLHGARYRVVEVEFDEAGNQLAYVEDAGRSRFEH
jgi:hypothetical protein